VLTVDSKFRGIGLKVHVTEGSALEACVEPYVSLLDANPGVWAPLKEVSPHGVKTVGPAVVVNSILGLDGHEVAGALGQDNSQGLEDKWQGSRCAAFPMC
jgi:hypothetical protein